MFSKWIMAWKQIEHWESKYSHWLEIWMIVLIFLFIKIRLYCVSVSLLSNRYDMILSMFNAYKWYELRYLFLFLMVWCCLDKWMRKWYNFAAFEINKILSSFDGNRIAISYVLGVCADRVPLSRNTSWSMLAIWMVLRTWYWIEIYGILTGVFLGMLWHVINISIESFDIPMQIFRP